jgi:prephenate dehydrogenase
VFRVTTRLEPILGTVVIAGVGLIGGSVALGLRGRFIAREVIGFDADPETLTTALGLGVIDAAHVTAGAWLKDADLVILAAPVRALPDLASQMAKFAGPDTVFTDVGSVKAPLLDALSSLPPELRRRFVGGHPMAGSERAGVQHASAGLLENAIWVLTPTPETDPNALEKVRQMVESLGANPVVLEPDAHDRLVATVSHLPYLSALALTRLIARHEDRDGLALLAAGGFRDLTRVASGDPRMSRDMVVENKTALREAIQMYRAELEALEAMLDVPDTLMDAALEGKRTRDSLPVVRRSLLPALHDLVVAIPDKPGEFARITTLVGDAGINIKDIEVLAIRDQGGAVRLGFASPDDAAAGKMALERAGYAVRGRG